MDGAGRESEARFAAYVESLAGVLEARQALPITARAVEAHDALARARRLCADAGTAGDR